jgi:DNA-binding NarL/FixJ family response regulator
MAPEDQPQPLRVLVVDDHEVVRQGLIEILERRPAFHVVAEAGTVADAILESRRHHPDLVLMDLRLPDGSGIEACRAIHHNWPDIRVVVLTSFADDETVLAAMAAGASGFLLKEMRARALATALEELAGGQCGSAAADTERALRLVRRITAQRPVDELAALSSQERRILMLLADGMTNKEIAKAVALSDKTVKNYVSSILSKLHLERRAQAAAVVARRRRPGEGLWLTEA